MTTFTHIQHPHVEARKQHGPPLTSHEHIGFNGRLGAAITRAAGTMWAFYGAALFMAAWMALAEGGVIRFDPFPFAFLLFMGNIVQLLLMFVIMVGQQVLGAAADKRAVQTYRDAEAILHECLELERHLQSQDTALGSIVERFGASSGEARPASP
jgi:uncharacterized membrane protein